MAPEPDEPQRITRLTPLDAVLARIDQDIAPVAPQKLPLDRALSRVLAEDAVIDRDLPETALALRDGFAVRAEATADAGGYAPVPLAVPPLRLDVGDPMPADADAVAPLDAVVAHAGRWEMVEPVTAGDGVLAAGADFRAGARVRRAGERLRASDIAVLAASDMATVGMRVPCVELRPVGRGDTILQASLGVIASVIAAAGGRIHDERPAGDDAAAERTPDLIVVVGGTGSGRRDAAVRMLDRVEAHGIALTPGETAAFGWRDRLPVLLVPGRLDAAIAVWLVLGRPILAKLTGSTEEGPVVKARLSRKIASALGLAEVIPVRVRDGAAEPIASGYLPLSAIAQADGWVFVRPESEGYPAGAEVMIRPWP